MPVSQNLQRTEATISENYFLAYRDFASQLAGVSQNYIEVIRASISIDRDKDKDNDKDKDKKKKKTK
jgi:hypothetical protein